MRRVSWHAAAAIVVLVAAAAATGAFLRSGREVDEGITSVALGGRVHARVILPAGYDDVPHRRYPVVYFLHGLPGSSSSYQGNDWLLDAIQQAGPAILVLPQGARDSDTDPEYLDWGVGRNWATYVSTELPGYIDAHFRTLARREGRAIVGVSAGGYGAAVTGLNHLGRFSVIESWSGYFHPTDPTGTRALARGRLSIVHRLIGDLKSDLRAALDVSRVLRRPRGRAVPPRERPVRPGADGGTRPARVRGLRRRAHDVALAAARSRLAAARARSSRQTGVTLA